VPEKYYLLDQGELVCKLASKNSEYIFTLRGHMKHFYVFFISSRSKIHVIMNTQILHFILKATSSDFNKNNVSPISLSIFAIL
jgi:hypothetical protein